MLDKLLPLTGIGSLNFNDPLKAVEYSSKFDIPFLPQLPSIDGNMIEVLESNKYSTLDAFKDISSSCKKIQVCGPWSSNKDPEDIYSHLEVLSKSFSNELFISLDEPVIGEFTSDYLKIIKKFKDIGKVGIHCCNKFEKDFFKDSNLDFISYDTSLVQSPTFQHIHIMGIIPTLGEYSLEKIYRDNKDFVLENYNRIILSPACGLADESIDCEKVFSDLKKLRSMFLDNI